MSKLFLLVRITYIDDMSVAWMLSISVSMMSRLTLDLHNTAMQRQNDLITGPFSGVAHRVEFTSQITVAESDEDAFDDVCLSDSESLSDA